MKRKVVLHGPSTLTVSLPSSWVRKFGIRKGDEVYLEEQDGDLRLSVERDARLGKKEISIKDLKLLGKTYLTSSYRLGYDEIHVQYDKGTSLEEIRKLVANEITGFEIVRQDHSMCVLKDLIGHARDEFDTALRRIWLLVLDLSLESLEAVREENLQRLRNIQVMDQSINKFCNYCLRILTKKGYSDFRKTPLYYYLVKTLESIADRYKDLCNVFVHSSEKPSKEFVEMFESINRHLQELYELFYVYDEQEIEALLTKVKKTYREITKSQNVKECFLSSLCKDITDSLEVFVELRFY